MRCASIAGNIWRWLMLILNCALSRWRSIVAYQGRHLSFSRRKATTKNVPIYPEIFLMTLLFIHLPKKLKLITLTIS